MTTTSQGRLDPESPDYPEAEPTETVPPADPGDPDYPEAQPPATTVTYPDT